MRLALAFILVMSAAACCAAEKKDTDSVLSSEDKACLLNLARQTLSRHLKGGSVPNFQENGLSDGVKRKLGCFVTLNNKKDGLRGCIGTFTRSRPLYSNVVSLAVSAAHDRRFRGDPVAYEELEQITIEISVLTRPRELSFASPDNLLKQLRHGKDGVILYTRYGNSTYLPQVWAHIPDKAVFLSRLCRKHGAPPDTWRKDFKNIKVEIYEAIVFHE
ncbi:MAG: AmmeMemoRadiSam system protein A [Verrucomicrobiota bacterium]